MRGGRTRRLSYPQGLSQLRQSVGSLSELLSPSCTVGYSLVTGHVHDASSVSLHVQGQVVAARERPRAEVALEGLGPGVLPVVPRQLV